MKRIWSIDFLAQTLILLTGGLVIAFHVTNWLSVLLFTQASIGFWQFWSSLLTLSSASRHHTLRIWHFTASLVDILAIVVMLSVENNSLTLLVIFVFVLPGILAIGYYTLTILELRVKKTHTGSFLPHTSF